MSLDHGLINEPHPIKQLREERRKYICERCNMFVGPCLFIGLNIISFVTGYYFYYFSVIYEMGEDGSL